VLLLLSMSIGAVTGSIPDPTKQDTEVEKVFLNYQAFKNSYQVVGYLSTVLGGKLAF